MPRYGEIAADIRMVAAGRGMTISEREVDTAIRLHLRGKGYLDAIKQACGGLSHAEELKHVSQKEARMRSASIGGRRAAERKQAREHDLPRP